MRDGGRPIYPIHLLHDVFRNPNEHAALLRPWRYGWWSEFSWKWKFSDCGRDISQEIFQRQLERWQDFRKWQNDNRGIDDDLDYEAYVNTKVQWTRRFLDDESYASLRAMLDADPSSLKRQWEQDQDRREEQRYRCRESGGGRDFAAYARSIKRRLAQHGFTRPFQLQKDPRQ